jgi:hypothetical protein
MQVAKLALLPTSLSEDVDRSDACRQIGHVINKVNGMLNCEWPQRWISGVWPMDCGVQHHGTCNVHD